MAKENKSVLAIIPARGGSKGILKKNLRPVGGIPLIARTIIAAKTSKLIDRIIVSTDDKEIASIAEDYGSEISWRPSNISGDLSSSESALLYVLEKLKDNEQYVPDITAFLQCTSPFLEKNDIDGTISSINDDIDSAFSATSFHHFLWGIENNYEATGINHDSKSLRKRRQDIDEKQYLETGSVYAFKTNIFLLEKSRFCGKVSLWEQKNNTNIEIDLPIDLEIANAIESVRLEINKTKFIPQNIQAIVFDFDGVFTDDNVITNSEGVESVTCSRSDGMGINNLQKLGIKMLVISKEKNKVVEKRCKKLNLDCLHSIDNKIYYLEKWLKELSINPLNVIYVGNDINDIDCLKYVGCPAAPANYHPDISKYIKLKLSKKGGEGAVRELSDIISYSLKK